MRNCKFKRGFGLGCWPLGNYLQNARIHWLLFMGMLCSFVTAVGTATQGQSKDFGSSFDSFLTVKEIEQGWLMLFDGQSLFGWRTGHKNAIELHDSSLKFSDQHASMLRTSVQFDDFDLRLDFRSDCLSDASLFVRSSPAPKANPQDGIEIKLLSKDKTTSPGTIVSLKNSQPVILANTWNELHVAADGNELKVWVNGRLVNQILLQEKSVNKGYIGFTCYAGGIQIRNIRLLPKNLPRLFNGEDLAGWRVGKKMDSSFDVSDGQLNIKGGRGQLESQSAFGDFVFSCHCRTNSSGLNSGIFFRCIPGDLMNGYESQIQNVVVNDNRREPADCGTGGIFRKQDARWVNSVDESWFAKTIVADGATFGVWVNGLLVSNWTDNRKSNINPRKGRRLKKGTIIVQGHDPTTDLSFKNIRCRELSRRRN